VFITRLAIDPFNFPGLSAVIRKRLLGLSGTFNAADTDSFAAFLESLEGVRVERLPTRFNVLNSHGKTGSTARNT